MPHVDDLNKCPLSKIGSLVPDLQVLLFFRWIQICGSVVAEADGVVERFVPNQNPCEVDRVTVLARAFTR